MSSDIYIPKLEKNANLTEPIQGKLLIDNSSNFDLPFELKDMLRIVTDQDDEPIENKDTLGVRSITDGRAVNIRPFQFRGDIKDPSLHPVIFYDLLLKGVGADISPNIGLYEETESEGTEIQIPIVVKDTSNRLRKVRFSTKNIKGLTSFLGIHTVNAGTSDNYMSKYLSKNGLRTRSLIALWELPDELELSTSEGLMSVSKFKELTKTKPAIEAWGMRCKYRMHDISRLIEEIDMIPDEGEPQTLLNISRLPKRIRNPESTGLSHYFDKNRFFGQRLELLRSNMEYLANEIRLRAETDEDPRFSSLAQRHQTIAGEETTREFFTDYLSIFTEIYGEQMARLDLNNAISGMFNAQNVSLLAEVFDHDVTMVNGKVMGEEGKLEDVNSERLKSFDLSNNQSDNYIIQFRTAFIALNGMVKDLNRTGTINLKDDEYLSILKTYVSSFFKTLEQDPVKLKERKDGIRKEIEDLDAEHKLNELEDEDIDQHIIDPFGDDIGTTYIDLLREFI